MYSDSTLSALASKKWVPAGYITRDQRDEAYWHRRPSILDENHISKAADGPSSIDEKYDGKNDSSPDRNTSVHRETVGDDRKV